jgi:AcrR family transcriptional regulator
VSGRHKIDHKHDADVKHVNLKQVDARGVQPRSKGRARSNAGRRHERPVPPRGRTGPTRPELNTPSPAGRKARTRDGLLRAVTEVVAARGYSELTVDRVIEQAGVARATFYAHFRAVDQCLLAALEQIGETVVDAVAGAGRDGSPGLAPAVALLVDFASAETAAARALFVDSLAAGPRARAIRDRTCDRIAALVESETDIDGSVPVIVPAVLGGTFRLLAMRLSAGATGLLELERDLPTWASFYCGRGDAARSDEGRSANPAVPPGKPALRPELPTSNTRGAPSDRIIAALGRLSRLSSYGAVSVADICSAARVSRKTFYQQFGSKREAALAMNNWTFQHAMTHSVAAYFSDTDWQSQVWSAGHSLTSFLAAYPDAAHLGFVECHAIGEPAVRQVYDGLTAFTLFLAEGYRSIDDSSEPPEVSSQAIAATLFELVYRDLVRYRRTDRLRDTLPPAVQMCLVPFATGESALSRSRVPG